MSKQKNLVIGAAVMAFGVVAAVVTDTRWEAFWAGAAFGAGMLAFGLFAVRERWQKTAG